MKNGFSLVEMLVVIGIIGVLATVVIVAVGEPRDEANHSAARVEMRQLGNMIELAKSTQGRTLEQITGSFCTECSCRGQGRLRDLPRDHDCWQDQAAAIAAINDAVRGMSLPIPFVDPWGAPYMINENEGEITVSFNHPSGCYTDNILSAGSDGIVQTDNDIVYNIDFTFCSPVIGPHRQTQNWHNQ